MADREFEIKVKQKQPKHYYPIRAEKIEHGKAYASIMVSEQETMMSQLRYMRKEMEREERKLKEMKDYLEMRQRPRKWTPYHGPPGDDW